MLCFRAIWQGLEAILTREHGVAVQVATLAEFVVASLTLRMTPPTLRSQFFQLHASFGVLHSSACVCFVCMFLDAFLSSKVRFVRFFLDQFRVFRDDVISRLSGTSVVLRLRRR